MEEIERKEGVRRKRVPGTPFQKNAIMAMTAIAVLAMILPLSGCSDEKTGLSIQPEIFKYTPSMSSTPGIPLVAVFTRKSKNKDVIYHWVAEEGTFLKWNNSGSGKGRIEVLGPDIKTNEHKVYWAVDPDHEIEAEAFEVTLTVEALDTGKVNYEASIEIEQSEPMYFVIEDEK